MKIRWYEILILALTALCILVFLGTYFATAQAPGIWISTEYSGSLASDTGEDELVEKREAATETELVNINTADQAELESLPGIGSVRASAILEYRNENGPFQSIEELLKVDGIGEKTLNKLRDLITVSTEN